jgi:hypothetical protein
MLYPPHPTHTLSPHPPPHPTHTLSPHPPPRSGIDPDAEEKKRREEEEAARAAARAHGTPVTVEAFMAWKAKYDAGGWLWKGFGGGDDGGVRGWLGEPGRVIDGWVAGWLSGWVGG